MKTGFPKIKCTNKRCILLNLLIHQPPLYGMNRVFTRLVTFVVFLISLSRLQAQVANAPARNEGDGPHKRLIIRGVTLINSTGGAPVGPVDIVVEKNRITQIRQVGFPGVPIDAAQRPQAGAGDKELNCEGMYLFGLNL